MTGSEGTPNTQDGPARYRVGRSQLRTIYDGEELFGMVDTPEQAAMIVNALNEHAPVEEAQREAERWKGCTDELRRHLAVMDRQLTTLRRQAIDGPAERRIREALDALPVLCDYHGENLDRTDGGYVHACCDTGKPARARREALRALTERGQP